jgi:hypothetical protein
MPHSSCIEAWGVLLFGAKTGLSSVRAQGGVFGLFHATQDHLCPSPIITKRISEIIDFPVGNFAI